MPPLQAGSQDSVSVRRRTPTGYRISVGLLSLMFAISLFANCNLAQSNANYRAQLDQAIQQRDEAIRERDAAIDKENARAARCNAVARALPRNADPQVVLAAVIGACVN
jgi:hypothetical protein